MRILSFIPALAALVTAVAGASVHGELTKRGFSGCHNTEMGCADYRSHHDHKRDVVEYPTRDVHALTNAELLRRGLPLNNPVMRRGTPVRRTTPSSNPPPVKITHTGIVEVHNADTDALLGYISTDFSYGARYTPVLADALAVSFQTDGSGSGSKLDISISNSNPSWPLFGLGEGRDSTSPNLAPGSFNYLYFVGVANPGTQPDDIPTPLDNSFPGTARTVETAVWSFDSGTGELLPQWINTDGTSPVEQIFTQSTILYISGDMNAFHSRFPAPVTPLTFKFVSN